MSDLPLSRIAAAMHVIAPALARFFHRVGGQPALQKMANFCYFLLGQGAERPHLIGAEVAAARSVVFRDKPVVFDVGGHTGEWSRTFLETAGEGRGGRVFIFEPQESCREKIRMLKLPCVDLIGAAVGENSGKIMLYVGSGVDDTASVHIRQDTVALDRVCAPVETDLIALDDFISERTLDFIDFVKMDIEGHELFALRGMSRALKERRIGALSFEFGCGNLNSRTCLRDFWEILAGDFDLFLILPSGDLRPLPVYTESLEYYLHVSNFVAVLKEHPYR